MTIFGSALGSSPHPPTFPRPCCDPKRTYFQPSTIFTYTLFLPPPPPPLDTHTHKHPPPNIFHNQFFDFSWDNCNTRRIMCLCENGEFNIVSGGRGEVVTFTIITGNDQLTSITILTSPLDSRTFDLFRITAVTVAILDCY